MSTEETESDVMQRVVAELQAEGYEVYLHPKRALLPEFLKDYVPDAIGRGSNHNIAIEILRESPDAKKKAEKIVSLFERREDWELRVVWITPASSARIVEIQSVSTIRKRI